MTHILKKIKMLTSNPFKTKEFQAMGVDVIYGDIREVLGTPIEVSIHKALAVDAYIVVEDSVVYMNGEPIVDWKFTFAEHATHGAKFDWHVNLSFHDNKNVYVYNGVIDCEFVLLNGRIPISSNFDDYAKLDTYSTVNDNILEEVKQTAMWCSIDPRAKALHNLSFDISVSNVAVESVQPWTGEYQE